MPASAPILVTAVPLGRAGHANRSGSTVALERQDNSVGEVEAELRRATSVIARLPHVVNAVDNTRRPYHKHTDGEDERRPQAHELHQIHAAKLRAPLPF